MAEKISYVNKRTSHTDMQGTSKDAIRRKLILAIETSCDETAAAVVRKDAGYLNFSILSSVVSSQVLDHARFGGVVPEVASRMHLENINYVIEDALLGSSCNWKDIDAIACTIGPGLIGALHVGLAAAKTLSMVHKKPLIGINHLEGHIYALMLTDKRLRPPLVCLIASGGHTSLVFTADLQSWEVMGETVDDAIGESYDKVAKLMDLGYPGGPIIDSLAQDHKGPGVRFTPPMLHSKNFNFSFSGVKTAVMYHIEQKLQAGEILERSSIARGFQEAVVKVAVAKLIRAARERGVKNIAITGGVSANSYLRKRVKEEAELHGMSAFFPGLELCTDNAAMIAAAAFRHYKNKDLLSLSAEADPSMKLG